MSPPLDRTPVILTHLEYLREGQDKTNEHLKELNGRVWKMEARTSALEAKADDAKTSGAKWGASFGAVIAGLIYGLFQYFK